MIFLVTSICLVLTFNNVHGACDSGWNTADILKLIPTTTACSCCNGKCGSGCSLIPQCAEAPPPCITPFKLKELSAVKVVTPWCLQEVFKESTSMVSYLELVARTTCSSPSVQPALFRLTQYAQVYAVHIHNTLKKFFYAKVACTRPIIRLHEAILETISQLACVAQRVDYNIKSSGSCNDCCDVSETLLRTVKVYIDLLTTVMKKMETHLCTNSMHYANDRLTQSADNIAMVARQLAKATGTFYATPSRCHDDSYINSVKTFSNLLSDIEPLTQRLEDALEDQLLQVFGLIEHKLFVHTYQTKLTTFDQHSGSHVMATLQTGYAHDVGEVIKLKDEHLQTIDEKIVAKITNHNNAAMTKKLLTELIFNDVQVLQQTTVLIDQRGNKDKLAFDLQTITEIAISLVKELVSKSGVIAEDDLQVHLKMAIAAEEYAMRVLDILQRYCLEDMDILTGINLLKEAMVMTKKQSSRTIHHVKDALDFAGTLKVVADIPATCALEMPESYFRLMRAMSETSKKFHEKVSHTVQALQTGEPALVMTELMNSFRSIITQTWRILLQNRCNNCGKRIKFVESYVKYVFDELAQLFPILQASLVDLQKAKELIQAEKDLMGLFASGFSVTNPNDIVQMKRLHESFSMFLTNKEGLKDQTKKLLETMLANVSPNSINECSQAFMELLRAMKAFTDA